MQRVGRGSSLVLGSARSWALLVVLALVITSGLLFTTQGGAHAYQGVAKAVSLLPSVAKTLAGVTPWGRAALTAAQLASLFSGLGVLPSFTSGRSANDDQAVTGANCAPWNPDPIMSNTSGTRRAELMSCSAAGSNQAGQAQFTYRRQDSTTGFLDFTVGVWFLQRNTSTGSVTTVYGTSPQCTFSLNGTAVLQTTQYPTLKVSPVQTVSWSCAAGFTVTDMTVSMGDWSGGNARTVLAPAPASYADPQRRMRPWSDCASALGGASSVVRAYGSWTLYKESTGFPEIVPPPCPAAQPARVGFGADSESLGTGSGVYGDRVPIIPPITRPALPVGYPNITPDDTVQAVPLPLPGPLTRPDGTTTAEPEPDAAGNYCTYGPYNIPASECNDPLVPVPGPTTAPAPTPTAPPDPNAYPRPVPQPVPVEAEGCMGEAVTLNPVTWVYAPVKCALSWAFKIEPATQLRLEGLGASITGLPPFNVLSALPGWLTPITNLGQTCPDWRVQVGPADYSVICDQGYTQKMHDNRTLFGAAMALALLGPFMWRVWHASIPVLKVNARAD